MAKYTDKELFNGVRCRNNDVLKYIYTNYFPKINHYVQRNRGEEQEAKDLFQEAIILIYRKLKEDKIDELGSFKSYFISVAKFIWLRKLRAGNIRKKYDEEIKQTTHIVNELSESYKINQKYLLYQKHFNQLNDTCKQLLQYYIKGYSNEEIAKMMGNKSTEYIKTKKYKCKELLVKKIKNDPEFNNIYLDDFLDI